MLKRGVSCILALTMILSIIMLVNTSLSESDLDYTEKVEVLNPFKDVDSEKYYFEPILTMYSKGIMTGYGDGYFGPDDIITHAQVLVMLTRLCKVDTSNLGHDNIWYSGAIEWAETRLGYTDIPVNKAATRMDIANYLIKALGKEDLIQGAIDDPNNPFIDTDSPVVEVLYNLGIVAGMPDGNGNLIFGGDQILTRGQTATFFTRVLNVKYTPWEVITEAEHEEYLRFHTHGDHLDHSFYKNITLPEVCDTVEDYKRVYEYMMVHHINEIVVPTTVVNESDKDKLIDEVMIAYKVASLELYEYSSFNDGGKLEIYRNTNGDISNISSNNYLVKLKIKHDFEEDEYLKIITEAENKVHAIIEELYNTNVLHSDMTIRQRAEALCKWMVINYQYDLTYSNYNIHDILTEHSATCSGYTALYTMLCRHVGIPIKVEKGEAYNNVSWGDHIWNYIDDCGECEETHYIDVTWCDPVPDRGENVTIEWFWVSKENWINHKAHDYNY